MFGPVIRYLERRRIDMVKPYVKGHLLDVGCGPNKLVREYGDGVGLDTHSWSAAVQVIGEAASLPFKDSSFDTVAFVACLNHIPNREAALREAWRVLSLEGLLLVTMIGPKISIIWHKILGENDPDQFERGGLQEGEVWGIKPSDMVGLIKRGGFQLLERKTFILGLNSLYVAKKVD